MSACKHRRVKAVCDSDERGLIVVVSMQCVSCNALGVRSLGPSVDGPPEVRVAIRAAEIAAGVRRPARERDAAIRNGRTTAEIGGWVAHHHDQEPPRDSATLDNWEAGWLAHAIVYGAEDRQP